MKPIAIIYNACKADRMGSSPLKTDAMINVIKWYTYRTRTAIWMDHHLHVVQCEIPGDT